MSVSQVRDVEDSVAAKGVRLVTLLVQSDEMPQEQVCLLRASSPYSLFSLAVT